MDYGRELNKKYPYLKGEEIDNIVGIAKEEYFRNRFPLRYHNKDLNPKSEPIPLIHEMLVLSICVEIVERSGISSAVAYKENGFSIDFDNAHLSNYILSQLIPEVGTLSRRGG